MKRTSIIVTIVALLVAMVVAGGNCGKAKEGELPTYSEGDWWEYKWVQDATEYTLTQEVTGEEVVEGRNCYAMDWSYEPPMQGMMSTMEYWVDKETLFSFSKMESSYEYNGQPVTWTGIYVL